MEFNPQQELFLKNLLNPKSETFGNFDNFLNSFWIYVDHRGVNCKTFKDILNSAPVNMANFDYMDLEINYLNDSVLNKHLSEHYPQPTSYVSFMNTLFKDKVEVVSRNFGSLGSIYDFPSPHKRINGLGKVILIYQKRVFADSNRPWRQVYARLKDA